MTSHDKKFVAAPPAKLNNASLRKYQRKGDLEALLDNALSGHVYIFIFSVDLLCQSSWL
ncbi:MAG: hypothetical protein IPN58_20155 [Anaerolineales bacterium]|nr:hypothetical protein [Anaerolineales bacterium]